MLVHDIWNLRGTPEQNRIIEETLERVDFPWKWLVAELQNEVGKSTIPVEWEDLSRYAEEEEDNHEAKMVSRKPRRHGGDADYHIVGYRNRVLGLAWYSGKVTLDSTLVNEPELAGEVFMSEGAHMVDFFYMDDRMRAGVWNAFHPDEEDVPLETLIEDGVPIGHNHGWFDVGGYYSWVGEAFMGGFVKAFSDLPVTISFDHAATPEAAAEIRRVFGLEETPEVPDEPIVEEPVAPEPTPEEPEDDSSVTAPDGSPFFGIRGSVVFHDSHRGIDKEVTWSSYEAAVNDRRPCKVCKPGLNRATGVDRREQIR